MELFWCIVLSTIVLRWWWKRNKPDLWEDDKKKEEIKEAPSLNMEAAKEMQKEAKDKAILAEAQAKLEREQREKQRQYDRDVAQLKKQGYTDELIAVIMPTINNGQ